MNTLVAIDIQREYTTSGRPFFLQNIGESLSNCSQVLSYARKNGWNIAHVQHLKEGEGLFGSESEYSNFIEGFEPKDGEKLFTKSVYSCYSSSGFFEFIESAQQEGSVYIIGYNSIMCCLSTVIEGFHRGHHLCLVSDASYAKSTAEFSEEDMHQHSLSLIKTAGFARLVNTRELLV